MSTDTTPPTADTNVPKPIKELKVYGHSTLFYWWPVWILGYVLAAITAFGDGRMAIVPSESQYRQNVNIENVGQQSIVLLPKEKEFPRIGKAPVQDTDQVLERVHPNKNLGIVFTLTLIVVICITNIPLRGLYSVVFVVATLLIIVSFTLFGWWTTIFDLFGKLSIHMNMGFFIFFSSVLLAAWLLVFLVFDRFSYWMIRPGQITHEFIFGGGQKSYSTDGMTFEKLRDDMFRHFVLGFGSGDMVMHPMTTTGGRVREELYIHNVLFVGNKIDKIQNLIAERPV